MTKIKRSIYLFLACIMFFSSSVSTYAAVRFQETDETIVIVIDPGHGGENLGTIENGFLEKEMTLTTAKSMYEELCQYDNVEVYLTRTDDVDLTLKERAEYAASVNADFLFSIHYNASVDHDLFGSEIWISATPPYNAYAYQFGYKFQEQMRDMGLYLRGIKTKLNDKQTDYYGIIRESTALSVPSAIIEHCHVDEVRDYTFCDTDEELIAFGKADALAVAKYFGLKSTSLGVDYSNEFTLPQADQEHAVKSTLLDETPPDVCVIELAEIDENTGKVKINVSAADYDSPMLYYDYSYDGGFSYSPLQMWPGSDVLKGTYTDTFSVTLEIPSGVQPQIILRAYNMFDAFTESNKVAVMQTFHYGEDATEEASDSEKEHTKTNAVKEEKKTPGTTTFMPVVSDQTTEDSGEVSFFSFLKLCLVIVILIFFFVLVSQAVSYSKRRKRRRQRRNVDGETRYHDR